jgi:hypothetical protein
MKHMPWTGIAFLCAGIICSPALAQQPAEPQNLPGAVSPAAGPSELEWAPSALAQLQAQATTKSSFTLDRTMLGAFSSFIPNSEPETRQAIGKIDSIGVQLLRFGANGPDETLVGAIRQGYHLRGWKHLVTSIDSGGPVRSQTTDVWLVLSGANVRGAVVLVETPKSVTLVTLAGNLSTVDLLHLRGHFWIPRFKGDGFGEAKDRDR